ncbi:hypothetical protein FPV67DRAFT_774904 [Lyophyllum atratum]|nr:hypothetical protein FPV67DRAFT_774904 [Lyophyllum atratum]
MQAFHRKPPPKKRHTKPCRFFQTSRCPLSAQECDFSHVLSNEVPLQSPNPCRYYAAGRCGHGSACRYRHVMEGSADVDAKDNEGHDDEPAISPRHPLPEGTAPQKLATAPVEASVPFESMYSTSHGWRSPYPNPAASPTYSPGIPPPQLYYCDFFSPTHPAESSATLSVSTSSSFSDDAVFLTDDPKYSEHYHQYQSQICIAEEQPLIHVPPFYHSPNMRAPVLALDTSYPTVPNMYGTYGFQPPISPSSPVKSRTQSRSVSRHKAINYKTKPCRFYRATRSCPNGSECTFIHDEPTQKAASPFDSPPLQSEQMPNGLPPKPASVADENKKKNYFPISWRVIGGGVLMGGPRPLPVSQDKIGRDKRASQDAEMERNSLPPKPITRTRSSSNPPTPTMAHVKVDTTTVRSCSSILHFVIVVT